MKTFHQVVFHNSNRMPTIPSDSVALMVTSPPYPMIQMWDELFIEQNPAIGDALETEQGLVAFELMHQLLDTVWGEVYRVLKKGGIACINVGDATRTIKGHFSLYQNHTRIMSYLLQLGLNALPCILWRKQTNAPNKFMGSGMLPPTAYVTLEHEYILIVRKGGKREFKTLKDKKQRQQSAFFWEERNAWYSDIWEDLKGTSQRLFDATVRNRSAAFPFEIPYRLINMFSVKGDTVLDPFLGIGTTMYAAMASARSSVGFEIHEQLRDLICSKMGTIVDYANDRIDNRLRNHLKFVKASHNSKGKFEHFNKYYEFPVMTKQETRLLINPLMEVKQVKEDSFEVTYSDEPQRVFRGNYRDLE
ncbi:MAG: site-specific DNA-methyltransferase [Desulfobacterales bacterium]|nr:MAG: site-specific DNA-methyltransferase [Desulfobacterales bacterium]